MFFWIIYECSFVFGWISRKIEEIRKIWAKSGVLRRGEGTPHRSEGPRHDVACPRRGVTKRKNLAILGFAVAKLLFTTHKFMCFVCFVFLLLRGLIYWTNEDPISV